MWSHRRAHDWSPRHWEGYRAYRPRAGHEKTGILKHAKAVCDGFTVIVPRNEEFRKTQSLIDLDHGDSNANHHEASDSENPHST